MQWIWHQLLILTGSEARPSDDVFADPIPKKTNERWSKYEKSAENASSPIFRQVVLPSKRGIQPKPSGTRTDSPRDNPSMSFVMLSGSPLHSQIQYTTRRASKSGPNEPRSPFLGLGQTDLRTDVIAKIDYAEALFDILSARSDIDHPICSECTELVLSGLQARLAASIRERDAFNSCLKDLKNNAPSIADAKQAEDTLDKAKALEDKAYQELLALEQEKAEFEDELAELDAESRELDQEEEEYWRKRNAFDLKLSSVLELKDTLSASYHRDLQQLERLRRTNVYNDTFCIGHDGHFGTINSLRLGRLPPPNNVEWAEINAAWGYTALLLKTVADKLGFSFSGYAIKPMGSTSHIEKLDLASTTGSGSQSRSSSRTESGSNSRLVSLELFSSGDLPLGRQILHRRFNEAMVAFLECLRQLGDHVRRSESNSQRSDGLRLPYTIEKDRINGISIKLGASQDEQWTSACKYTLTCCKFLLAHASNENTRREAQH